ncbi:MAG: hypothetical protein ACTSRP_09125 [Candidatus Helarchaeota archaeon]
MNVSKVSEIIKEINEEIRESDVMYNIEFIFNYLNDYVRKNIDIDTADLCISSISALKEYILKILMEGKQCSKF